MKKRYWLIVGLMALLVVSGCNDKYVFYVECDSGFRTPDSYNAFVSDGVVVWKVGRRDGNTNKRKMLPGEVCAENFYIYN